MSLLNLLLVFLMPFVVIGIPGAIALVSFEGRPARPSRRPVFVVMAPAGGGWS
jgi:hypothetical protein